MKDLCPGLEESLLLSICFLVRLKPSIRPQRVPGRLIPDNVIVSFAISGRAHIDMRLPLFNAGSEASIAGAIYSIGEMASGTHPKS